MLSLLIASTATADNQDKKHSFGISILSSTQDSSDYEDKMSSTGFGLNYNYHFNQNFAFDFGFFNHGKGENSGHIPWVGDYKEEVKSSSTNIGLAGFFPINNRITVLAKSGIAISSYNYDGTNKPLSNYTYYIDGNVVGFYLGIGLRVRLSENGFIGLEYTKASFDLDEKDFLIKEYNTGSLALSFGSYF